MTREVGLDRGLWMKDSRLLPTCSVHLEMFQSVCHHLASWAIAFCDIDAGGSGELSSGRPERLPQEFGGSSGLRQAPDATLHSSRPDDDIPTLQYPCLISCYCRTLLRLSQEKLHRFFGCRLTSYHQPGGWRPPILPYARLI